MKFFFSNRCEDIGTHIRTVEANSGSYEIMTFDTPSGDYYLLLSDYDHEEYFEIPESHPMYNMIDSMQHLLVKEQKQLEAAEEKQDEVYIELHEDRISMISSCLGNIIRTLHCEENLLQEGDAA